MAKYDVFVGYRQAESEAAARLIAFLMERGVRCMSVAQFPAGTHATHKIHAMRAIEKCDSYILLVGPTTFESTAPGQEPWLLSEATMALQQRKEIIPVAVNTPTFPPDLPPQLAAIANARWYKLREGAGFFEDLTAILAHFIFAGLVAEAAAAEAMTQFRAASPAPDATPQRDAPRKVFLSHSTADGAADARALASALEAQDRRCWIAPRDVVPGQAYSGQIVRAIRACNALVIVLTEKSNESADVLQEVQLAHVSKKLIVPVVVGGISPGDDLIYFLNVRHQIAWSGADDTAKRLLAVI